MMFQVAFQTNRSFCDHKKFPKGFCEGGAFTAEQADLLEKHGHAYFELAEGARKALMPLEKQFIEFLIQDKEPSNIHEQTWLCYVTKAAET